MQGKILQQRRAEAAADAGGGELKVFYRFLRRPQDEPSPSLIEEYVPQSDSSSVKPDERLYQTEIASAFLRLCHLNNGVIERLGRYETMLWRQTVQIMLMLGTR